MSGPVWLDPLAGPPPLIESAPLLWHIRLDDPATEALARSAPLRSEDLRDLAGRPQSDMRALRRQLVKYLLARIADIHPDRVEIGRSATGAPMVLVPDGWHISVAGQWPHCLIGLSRQPIGVDIEPTDAEPPPWDAFTAQERSSLNAAVEDDRLPRWLAKEAHSKLFGVAATVDPVEMETSPRPDGYRTVSSHGATDCTLHRRPDVLMVVASPLPTRPAADSSAR